MSRVDETWLSDGVDLLTQSALQCVLTIIRDGGGTLYRVKMPDTYAASSNWEAHCGVQTALAHSLTYPDRPKEYGLALSCLIDIGRALSGIDYQRILLDAQRFNGELEAVFGHVYLLLAPVQPVGAPTHEQIASLALDPEMNRS